MTDLVAYEHAVVDLLFRRDPEPYLRALGGRTDRWRVYRRMARRRLTEVIDRSFDKTARLLGAGWEELVARFFDEAEPRSRYLRDVPAEVLAWLERVLPAGPAFAAAPPWILELARHEVAVGEVSFLAEERAAMRFDVGELRMDRPAVLAPAHRLLRARFAVHRLGDDLDRTQDEVVEGPFALLLYRDPITHEVRALELSPVAATLLEGVAREEDEARAGRPARPLVEVVRDAAAAHGVPIDPDFVTSFSDTVTDLIERGLWLGSLADG